LDITSPNLGINSVDYKFPSTATDGRFLKHNSGGNLEWVLPTSFIPQAGAVVLNKVLPVGSILPYTSTTLPTDGNFLPCDGTERLTTDFPELAELLGITYGTPSTSGKFKLPNLNGRVPVGNGTGNDGTDSCAFIIGGTGGEYNHQLSIGEMPKHKHEQGSESLYNHFGGGTTVGGRTYPSGPYPAINKQNTSCLGDDELHNNIQPYTVTKYIIKAKPDEVIQYNPTLSNGLSALDGTGSQTNTLDLSTTEIGLKVTSNLGYDGAGNLDIVNVDFAKLTLPPNFPVQTVQAVKKDTQAISGPALGVNNFVEITGMSKTITRHNTGSKVRIQVNLNTATNSGHHGVAVRLLRDGVVVDEATGNQAGSRLRVTSNGTNAGAYGNQIVSFDFIDTPPVSESGDVNYSIDAKVYSAITGYINRDWYNTNINDYSFRTISTLTLTELTPDV